MPLTPFVGLSVFIHVCIIAGHGLIRYFGRKEREYGRVFSDAVTRALSVFVMFAVFAFVVFQAVMLVRASVHDKYSSIRLVKHAIESRGEPKALVLAASAAPLMLCDASFDAVAARYGYSLSAYLEAHGSGSSYAARMSLATEAGIAAYNATAGENMAILRMLIRNAPPDERSCG